MNSTIRTTLCAALIAATATVAHAQQPFDGLKDAYEGFFKMGVAVNQRNIADSLQSALLVQNYNSITAENDMKPEPTEPSEGNFRWDTADRIANFCRKNGLRMRGHCLVWHNQIGRWMFEGENGQATKEELLQRMRRHIHAIVSRYRDVVYCWDVVNEAITDDPRADNPYRPSTLYQIAGEEFIEKAFVYAHEADPDALLFYNDYNETDPVKCERICQMVERMKARGIPIHGIGMQGHYNIHYPDSALLEAAINNYRRVVDHIHVTELDIRANREKGGQLQFSRTVEADVDSLDALLTAQYTRVFDVFRRHADVIDCVTFWNLSDRDSWLGADNYATPFDTQYQPKPAYYGIRDWR